MYVSGTSLCMFQALHYVCFRHLNSFFGGEGAVEVDRMREDNENIPAK